MGGCGHGRSSINTKLSFPQFEIYTHLPLFLRLSRSPQQPNATLTKPMAPPQGTYHTKTRGAVREKHFNGGFASRGHHPLQIQHSTSIYQLKVQFEVEDGLKIKLSQQQHFLELRFMVMWPLDSTYESGRLTT